jgi:hypothetical protein
VLYCSVPIGGRPLLLKSLKRDDIEPTGKVEVHAVLTSTGRQNLLLEQIVTRLSLEPGVTSRSTIKKKQANFERRYWIILLSPLKAISCKYFFEINMRRLLVQLVLQILSILIVFLAAPQFSIAQTAPSAQTPARAVPQKPTEQPGTQTATPPAPDSSADQSTTADPKPSDPATLLPHSNTSRYWISGQANIVLQWHPSFPAKYSGPNSLSTAAQSAATHILTLCTSYQLSPTMEVFADIEYATGGGIGSAFGLAGYTNLDSVRTVQGIPLANRPYLARLMMRQIIPLTQERVEADRDELHLGTSLPARRIEFRIGKFDLADFFDLNSFASNSHLQFLNWTVDNNGAYDYAANTRGYTDGAGIEYHDHWFSARFGETLMPKIANGTNLDADIARARSENFELEARGKRSRIARA